MEEKLRLRYPNFDDALKFAKKRNLPTGKCEVWAVPRSGHDPVSYGYSNGLHHVAAAICFYLEDEARGEAQYEMNELNVRKNDGWAYVCVEDYELVYFEPLTPYEIKKIRSTNQATRRKSAKKTSRKTPTKRRKDPFATGLTLYPYMPGGEWDDSQ